jgi:hypothetical protein
MLDTETSQKGISIKKEKTTIIAMQQKTKQTKKFKAAIEINEKREQNLKKNYINLKKNLWYYLILSICLTITTAHLYILML